MGLSVTLYTPVSRAHMSPEDECFVLDLDIDERDKAEFYKRFYVYIVRQVVPVTDISAEFVKRGLDETKYSYLGDGAEGYVFVFNENPDERICLPYAEMNRTDREKDVLYAKTVAYQSGGANPAFYSSGVSNRIVFTKAMAIQHYADYFMQNGRLAPYDFNTRIVSQFKDNKTFLVYS